MPLSPDQLIPFAKELADASAETIRHYFRTDYEVISKADASPVTIADRRRGDHAAP
ncbi:MAG: hypothetical protein R3E79_39445 [Caldilineaceae bacterium]